MKIASVKYRKAENSPTGASLLLFGWDGKTRTCEYQSQSLVPYHLATSQYVNIVLNYTDLLYKSQV